MISKLVTHIYILSTIIFTVYSQLVMRWRVGLAGTVPPGIEEKLFFVGKLLINPWVLSGIFSTFLAGVSWMLAMTRFEISYAFPFVSLNYVVVLVAGYFLFGESFGLLKLAGTALIVVGLVVIAKG